jgi:hypothetical protein
MPHLTIFPWSYGHHIAPTDWKSPCFTAIPLSYFSYGWFSDGGPPTQLHRNQRYLAHFRRHRCPTLQSSHGDMAMILHPERAYRIYYKQQSSNYFSYGWFSAGGPPTTYAPSCEHIPCQLSWPSPMPIKYEHLFMELQPQYCPDREDTSPTSYGYTYCYLHPHPEKRTINNGCGLILC